jgi:hypothetical protein
VTPSVRFVAVAPVIAVFAGTGLFGQGADGVQATKSTLQEPGGLVQNGSDVDFYDCDRIRAVGPDGVIRTLVAGRFEWNCNTSSIGGLALDARDDVLIGDGLHNMVQELAPNGALSTFAGPTGLYGPTGVAVDHHGNTYISDTYDHVVKRVDPNGVLTTFAGDGSNTGCPVCAQATGGPATQAQLYQPVGLAVDADDDVYVTDAIDDRVLKIAPDGTLAEVIGMPHPNNSPRGFSGDGGPATQAELDSPLGVTLDRHGNLFIADTGNQRVREVDAATGIIKTVAGGGTAPFPGAAPTAAELPPPLAVMVDNADNMYISTQHLVLKIGAPTPAAAPVSAAEALPLPSARTCTSRRAFPIHVRRIKGITYASATVTVNGRRVPVYVYTDRRVRTTTISGTALNDRRFRAFVDLRGLARGTYRVAITATTTAGQTLHATRTYHTCRGESLSGGLPKL